MNVNNKVTKLFTISDITEDQVQDLLSISIKVQKLEVLSLSECETINSLRQTLLSAGIKKGADK